MGRLRELKKAGEETGRPLLDLADDATLDDPFTFQESTRAR